MHDSVRPHHLTRIRPNNCAFKDTFFGSNPFEFNCGAIKIGHGWHFTRCGEAEQSETARSGSGRQSPKHYSIRTEQAHTDWTRRFIVFHTKRNNGVWRDPREGTGVEGSEFLTYFKASVRQFHTRDVCSRA
jgi:hypothetical protein